MKKGFTLIEVTFVLAIIAIITAITLPYFNGIRNESKLTRAEAEISILKNAVENYYLQNGQFPGNITTDLTGATPKIVNKVLVDPFKTNGPANPAYGYIPDPSGKYYIIFSIGLDTVSQNWVILNPLPNTYIIDKNPGCHNIIESNLEISE